VHAGADIVKAGIDRLLHQGIHVHALGFICRTPDAPVARFMVTDFDLDK